MSDSRLPVCEPFSWFGGVGGVKPVAKPTHPVGNALTLSFFLLSKFNSSVLLQHGGVWVWSEARRLRKDTNKAAIQLSMHGWIVYIFHKVSMVLDLSICPMQSVFQSQRTHTDTNCNYSLSFSKVNKKQEMIHICFSTSWATFNCNLFSWSTNKLFTNVEKTMGDSTRL